MTPHEKEAKKIIEMFENVTALNLTLDEATTKEEITKHAKASAILYTDGLIKTLEYLSLSFNSVGLSLNERVKIGHYEKVKKAIENF